MTEDNLDVIAPDDEEKPLTVAAFKRYRRRTTEDLNVIVAGFQEVTVAAQARVNFVWNALNAILRAFLDNGLLKPRHVQEAGEKLMKEARENIERAEKGAPPGSFTPLPLESLRGAVYGEKQKNH